MNKIDSIKKYKIDKKRKQIFILFSQISIFALLISLWEILSNFNIINSFIFSSPSKIINLFISYLNSGELITHIYISTYEATISLLISLFLGIGIATLLYLNQTLSKILDPYLILINALPKSALAPILIIWLGANKQGIIGVSISFVMIIIIINTLISFKQVDQDLIVLLKSMNASKLQILFKVVFPYNLVNLFSLLKVGIGLSWVGVIVGEFLSSKSGIGYLIMYGGQVFKLDLVMMGIIVLSFIAYFMYGIVVILEKIVKKKYHF